MKYLSDTLTQAAKDYLATHPHVDYMDVANAYVMSLREVIIPVAADGGATVEDLEDDLRQVLSASWMRNTARKLGKEYDIRTAEQQSHSM
jgi:hypothetical protein